MNWLRQLSRPLLFLCGLWLFLNVGTAEAQAPRKTQKNRKSQSVDQRKGDGNEDGKDTVVGARWEFAATKVGSKEKVTFQYRINDGKIYDIKTNKQIGSASITQGKGFRSGSKVKFGKNSPFPSEFPLVFEKMSHWSGEFKKDKDTWKIKLTCLDR